MSYNHRPLGAASANPGPASGSGGPPNPRINDLLDFVRQEFDNVSSESQSFRMQNVEYENHAHGQLKEVAALRHNFIELEREYQRQKDQYEEEIMRLRRELDVRAGASDRPGSTPLPPTSSAPERQSQQPVLPTPQVPTGSSSLFGSIPTSSHEQHTAEHGPNGTASGSNWNAGDRLPMMNNRPPTEADHPSKRIRIDTTEASHYQPGRPIPAASTPTSHPPTPYAQPSVSSKPFARPLQTGASNASAPTTPIQQAPASATLPSTLPGELDVSKEKAKEQDWMTMYNPKVKRTLEVELVHTLIHDSVVCCVKFSPNGKLLATGCNRTTILYDTQTGVKHCTLVDPAANPKEDNYIRSASFSGDGKLLATGAEDRKIRVWDIAARRIRHSFEGHLNEIYSLVFSPDGKFLYSGSGDQTARIWDVESGTSKFVLTIDDHALSASGQPVDAGVTSIALSPNGKVLAAGSLDTVVRLWDTTTGKLIDKLKGHKDSVYSVAFAPDGTWLVSGSLDKTLKIWDLHAVNAFIVSGKESAVRKSVSPAVPAKEGENGAAPPAKKEEGAKSPAVPIADEIKTPCVSTLAGHKDYVLSVAVSPDGQWVVSGSKDRGVSFWDPKSTSATVVLSGHKNSVIAISIADTGNLLASGSGDWSCRVWRYAPIAP